MLILLSVLPLIQNQHWIFRVPEFMKIQLLVFQLVASLGLILFTEKNTWFYLVFVLQLGFIVYHLYLFARCTKFYKSEQKLDPNLKTIKVISTNIYQFNQDFERFKSFIRKEQPAIFITIESNKDWELSMREMETDYPYTEKITLENTYGMHLYSTMPFQKVTTHYFVAEDLPSIEAHFTTDEQEDFVLFCVHPPPPSPTEEETSKERDGDLLSIAKCVKKIDKPTLVVGDFNTVAWSKISTLFRKNSGLIDGRTGRGILASFHAKYWFFRAPLDLVFHSPSIHLKELSVLENIGSDHFPICCEFGIMSSGKSQEEDVEHLSTAERKETSVIIEAGKNEVSAERP